MTLTITSVATKSVAAVNPADVRVLPCARPLVEKAVLSLIDSFEQVGVLNKPMIRYGVVDSPTFSVEGVPFVSEDANATVPILVFGRHRMSAWGRTQPDTTMDMDIFAGDADAARKLEITENLHRCELNALQTAEQTAEWMRITGREVEAKTGVVQNETQVVEQAATALNRSASDVRHDLAIDKLSPTVKQAAIDAGLADRKTSLVGITRIEKKEGEEAALAAVAAEAERIKLPRGQKGLPVGSAPFKKRTPRAPSPVADEPVEEAPNPSVDTPLPWEEPVTDEPAPVNADGSVEAASEAVAAPVVEEPSAPPVAVKLLPLRDDEKAWKEQITALWNDAPSLRVRGMFFKEQGFERVKE